MLDKIFTSSFVLPFLTESNRIDKDFRTQLLLDHQHSFWGSMQQQASTVLVAVLSWLDFYDPQPVRQLLTKRNGQIYGADLQLGLLDTFAMRTHQLEEMEFKPVVASEINSCAIVFDKNAIVEIDCPLVIHVDLTSKSMVLGYSPNHFTPAQIGYMINHFSRLAGCMAPAKKVHDVEWLTHADRDFLLLHCNSNSRLLGIKPIPEYVQSAARDYPDKIALRYESSALTYAQLEQQTAAISAALQARKLSGVIGVYIPRSHLNVIALLGIWRAGLTYLPLPVDYPQLQLLHICAENNVKTILVCNAHSLPVGFTGVEAINIEQLAYEVQMPDRAMELDAIGAVMYTSGTTGMPKGVKHSMRSLLNRFGWWQETYPAPESEVFSQRTAISFIPSLWEMVAGVIHGCPLVVLTDNQAKTPDLLLAKVREERITRVALLPSFLNVMIASDKNSLRGCESLRYLILAGEPVSAQLLEDVKRQLPQVVVVNDYGATEVNGVLSCDSQEFPVLQALPAGRPISNCQAYVLGVHQQLLPCGVKGELYVGGIAASSAYVNLPEANKEKYGDIDFGDGKPRKLFRTNDLAMRHLDGTIQILGRCDNMVKIRGIRVELEAVEQAILQHASIKEVAASTEKSQEGVTRLIAFAVKNAGQETLRSVDVINALKDKVVEALVPARIEFVAALPKTANGKLNRKAIKNLLINTADATQLQPPVVVPLHAGPAEKNKTTESEAATASVSPSVSIEFILQAVAAASGAAREQLSEQDEFSSQGIDSAAAVPFMDSVSRALGQKLPVTLLYEYTTPRALFNYLNQAAAPVINNAATRVRAVKTKIAIVGLACRMPSAKNAQEFWQNLTAGRDAITEIPGARWDWRDVYSADPSATGKTNSRWGGFLDDIDQFDARFFNISGVEAKYMAPEQRLLLQSCWHAIEDAGYAEHDFYGRSVGVFIGARPADYAERIQQAGIQPDAATLLGNDNAILAARIAYYMNLKGPVITVDTACSSSAVAIHMACESILRGESDLVLAGGISLVTTPTQYLVNTKAGMLSPDGRCKTFDQSANGFVQGEGCGVVVLKPLEQALADQDRIYAVIEASGINQDGKTNGITAPSGEAQKKLLASLYDGEQINAANLAFIEAHGTGTKLGDPIEFNALNEILGQQIRDKNSCALGSVKTNIGHLISAAGIAGLIKIALSLHYKKIPPSLNYTTTNEHIELENSPFFVNTELRALPEDGARRLVGLSSFGFSGTNCHLILGTAPERVSDAVPMPASKPVFIVLTAKDNAGLRRNASNLRTWLLSYPEADLHHLSYTLARRANHFGYQLVCTAQSYEQLLESLTAAVDSAPSPYIFTTDANRPRHYNNHHFSVLANQLIEQLAREARTVDQEVINSLGVLVADGARANIRALFTAQHCELLAPPGFAFEPERFWIDGKPLLADNHNSLANSAFTKIEAGKGSYTLTLKLNSAGKQQWIFTIACAQRDYQGHVIDGAVWWPATAQIDALHRVIHHLGAEPSVQINEWQLGAPCVLDSDTKLVTLNITEVQAGEWKFEFSAGNKPFSNGRLSAEKYSHQHTKINLALLRSHCREDGDIDRFYSDMSNSGIHYGPGYRRITRLALGKQQVLSKVCLPAELAAAAPDYRAELLDAALHSVSACLDMNTRQVPVAVKKLVLLEDVPVEFASYIQVVHSSAAHTEANVWLFNKHGNVFCWVSGLQLQTVVSNKNSLDNCLTVSEIAKPLLYAPQWFDAPVSQTQSTPAVCWIGSAAGTTIKASKMMDVYSNYHQALEHMKIISTKAEKIVWEIECEEAHSLTDYCWQLVDFVAQLSGVKGAPRNLVVMCEHGSEWSKYLLALSGTVAALQQEYPHIKIKLVHGMNMDKKVLDAEIIDAGAATEVHRVAAGRVVPIWGQYQAKNVVAKTKEAEVSLITGGLGGVGRALAQQLAAHAGNGIVLVGRRAPNELEQQWIKSLGKDGAEVVYLQADVSSLAECQKIMRKINMRFNQLDNIYHCAGITRDALAFNKTREQVAEVIAAKVDSCENLDVASRNFKLKKFILFSSISAVLGTAGQTDYGAANAYLDVFARMRNQASDSNGHTLSINWPLWDVNGMRPDPASEKWLRESMGLFAMPAAIGVDLIDQLVADKLDQAMVLYGDEARLTKFVSQTLPVAIQPIQARA